MLASITPLGERGRSNRWATTVAAHIAAAGAASAAQGLLLGAVGDVLRMGTTVGMGVLAAAVAGAVVLDLVGARRPGLHRQVAEGWLDQYRGWVYGAGFGLQLGLGWATIVTTWLVWAALLGMVVAGSPGAGAIVGLAFGLGRGLPVLGTVRVVDGAGLHRLHRSLATWERPFRQASLAGAAGLAAVLAIAATAGAS